MINPMDSTSVFPSYDRTARDARGLVRSVDNGEFSLTPEKTEEEKQLENSTFSYSKQLTPEEEKRVLFLKNMLAQILAMADGQPTEEQKARIKEIENELAKITGVKTRSSISAATAKMPGKDDKEEEEEKKQLRGIDPKEAIHSRMPDMKVQMGPGAMQILQRNGIAAYLKNMDLSELGDLSSIKA